MNKKKLFNIILFCGIFLWMIPSAIFHQVDKRIVLFYFGFHIVISLLYAIQFLKVLGNKRNLKYEWLLMYLSVIGGILAHMATYIALLISGQESNIKIIYLVLILRAIVVIYFFVYLYSCYEEADLDKGIKNKLEIEKPIQIVITSHSPLILSDIPRQNIIYLNRHDGKTVVENSDNHKQSFGANIYTILKENSHNTQTELKRMETTLIQHSNRTGTALKQH